MNAFFCFFKQQTHSMGNTKNGRFFQNRPICHENRPVSQSDCRPILLKFNTDGEEADPLITLRPSLCLSSAPLEPVLRLRHKRGTDALSVHRGGEGSGPRSPTPPSQSPLSQHFRPQRGGRFPVPDFFIYYRISRYGSASVCSDFVFCFLLCFLAL